MADLARRPALGDETGALQYMGADFSLRIVTGRFITRLKWRPGADNDVSRLEQMTGLKLPRGPAHAAVTDGAVFWCAPGEWLIVSTTRSADELRKTLAELPGSVNRAVTDAGSGLTCIGITGSSALPKLARGCSAPLQDTADGHYLLTRLFGLPALLHKVDDSTGFDLYIDRSTSRWLWDCLLA
jgi:heterotetrameric sarcosine oxidase gamma subunit